MLRSIDDIAILLGATPRRVFMQLYLLLLLLLLLRTALLVFVDVTEELRATMAFRTIGSDGLAVVEQ